MAAEAPRLQMSRAAGNYGSTVVEDDVAVPSAVAEKTGNETYRGQFSLLGLKRSVKERLLADWRRGLQCQPAVR